MRDDSEVQIPPDARRVLGMDGVIVGSVLGAALTYWGGRALWHGEKIASTAVVETLLVALYLTMLVAYAGLRMPVFAHRSPFWSTFWLIMFAGHSSLLFDSFAVVLLLATGIVFLPLPGSSERYNQFFVKVAASFAALTVGGGFYLGELWGLPWYISNNLAEPLVGFPLLLVLTPACACLAYITARFHPVKMEPVVMDRSQVMAAAEFVVGLLLIIVTHSPVLCIGVLCIYTAVRSMTTQLVERTAHEFTSGAQNALGLILAAVAVQGSGLSSYVEPYLQGWGMFVGAAISSPFAGAMAPPVDNLHDFYVGLSMLMAGAPLFVFSSLVAIVVFTGRLEHEDLPPYMQRVISLWGARKSAVYVEEAVAYTLLVLPMVAVLGVMLTLANYYGVFMAGADFLGVTMK